MLAHKRRIKRIIEKSLEDRSNLQVNLCSSSARESLADYIVEKLNMRFNFTIKPFLPILDTIDNDADEGFGD